MENPTPSAPSSGAVTPVRCCDLLLVALAVSGFLGVALGAFGAHGLHDRLVANDRLDVWQTAVLYHLVHSVAALAALTVCRAAAVWWLAGVAVFSGSLYLLALTDTGWLGAVTPLGGVAFLIGWTVLGLAARRRPPAPAPAPQDR